ncbi:MAG: hypothetical protein U5L09_15825 [Bacteroidales bacterium]|nr:hypothetical protein [Bacteroidales bacterium]
MPLHAQDIDEDILLQRFRQNKKLDSLQNMEQKSAADKDEIATLKETLLDIDNQLFRNYINEGTIDSRRSRLRMLLNENNRLKAQQDSLRSLTRTMYIVIAVFILALLTVGYLLYHTWHKWRTEQQARQEIRKPMRPTNRGTIR